MARPLESVDPTELPSVQGGVPVLPIALLAGRAAVMAYRSAWLKAATPHVYKEAAAVAGLIGGLDFVDSYRAGEAAARRR